MFTLRALLLLIPVLLDPVSPLTFNLPANSKKCLHEDIQQNLLARGDYRVTGDPQTRTNLQITDASGQILYNKENALNGSFAFTTEEDDLFYVCFESHTPAGSEKVPDQEITLTLKLGAEATDYEELAKAEHLEPLEVSLRRVEDLAKSMIAAFRKSKKRVIAMRRTNNSTLSRLQYLTAFSMFCFIAMATWQILYLRRFFKKRKLID
ncbi:transmembrane emp24 domain-containing protein 10-like [Genypterus blacodes]|uniref:transmembrane emp24 domain-containing protein 10-like n=1 Tax=Genypterus blacodes TaxID=154954 RepID=UPI003F75F85A